MEKSNNHQAFMPIYVEHAGLGSHSIRHLHHRNQLPPSVPRQGASYFER